ncbi:MAG TPA: MBL fold metallo-hydrolase [Coriobacteriia bacterium]|nr:MBL fold metallo-hydrolase [Coriobacteriia bacterium]
MQVPLKTSQANTPLRLHVLASGSKGNATIVEDAKTGRARLIDCGICKRELFSRAAEVGVELRRIEGILITHEHTDHTKGLGVALRGLAKLDLSPVLYVSDGVRCASAEISSLQDSCNVRAFSAGSSFSLAGMEIGVFRTSHDADESFGFRISQSREDAIGYLTDSGFVTPEAFEALQDCRILAIEGNHDRHMLETGPYPYMLKQRVASDRGHLSNAQAADATERLLCNKLGHIVTMHVSENNNTYKLPVDAMQEMLRRNDHHAQVVSAFQHRARSV